MGQLERIWVKRFHRGPMDLVDTAELRQGAGMVDNADQGGWRQLTIISTAEWDSVVETLTTPLDPEIRRANLLVSGVTLAHSRDKILKIGRGRLRIRGETRPCERMDAAQSGLRNALGTEWRGGVFAAVLDDGEIRAGDSVVWID